MIKYFDEKRLLNAPTERAAFSDRQAYVCAEMARLAYFRFEGGHTVDEVLAIARNIVGEGAQYELLATQIRNVLGGSAADAVNSREAFRQILDSAGFELVECFNDKGTQAFACRRTYQRKDLPDKTIMYLAFRGTEPREFQDIKSDIRARLTDVGIPEENTTIHAHTGYVDALKAVQDDIVETMRATPHEQLIVCGHSLGGALAILYTRLFATGVNGACYTFGAPPVGDENVQDGLKTPVYEIINELDIVPRLPNPWLASGTSLLLRLFRLAAKSVTVVDRLLMSGDLDERLEGFIEMMTRYRHPGYTSFLVGVEKEARLRYNLGSYDRMMLWLRMISHRRHRMSPLRHRNAASRRACGSSNSKRVPASSRLTTVMRLPCKSSIRLTIARPMPDESERASSPSLAR